MRTTRREKVLYWLSTGVAALAFTAIGAADLLRLPAIMTGLTHLGYPAYFATILGVWILLGVAAIVASGLPRVKEWAYAGMFFLLTGAATSHAVSGDAASDILVPIVLLGCVMASWMLLPSRGSGGRGLAVVQPDSGRREVVRRPVGTRVTEYENN